MNSNDNSGTLVFQTSYAGSIPVTRSHEIPSLTSADNPEYKTGDSPRDVYTVGNCAELDSDSPVDPLADAHAALVADLRIALLEAEAVR